MVGVVLVAVLMVLVLTSDRRKMECMSGWRFWRLSWPDLFTESAWGFDDVVAVVIVMVLVLISAKRKTEFTSGWRCWRLSWLDLITEIAWYRMS